MPPRGTFNLHALIVLFGGLFILYTAVKEIFHMIGTPDLSHGKSEPRSVGKTIFWIVLLGAWMQTPLWIWWK